MGDLSMEGNFASYIDTLIVPGKLYLGIHKCAVQSRQYSNSVHL